MFRHILASVSLRIQTNSLMAVSESQTAELTCYIWIYPWITSEVNFISITFGMCFGRTWFLFLILSLFPSTTRILRLPDEDPLLLFYEISCDHFQGRKMVLTEASHLSKGKEGRWYTDSIEWGDLWERRWGTGRKNGNLFKEFGLLWDDWLLGLTCQWLLVCGSWFLYPGEDTLLHWNELR